MMSDLTIMNALETLRDRRDRLNVAIAALEPLVEDQPPARPRSGPAARTRPDRPSEAPTATGAPPARLTGIQARDAAILAHLNENGHATRGELAGILPTETPARTLAQRQADAGNACTRLAAKKQIRPSPDGGWALA